MCLNFKLSSITDTKVLEVQPLQTAVQRISKKEIPLSPISILSCSSDMENLESMQQASSCEFESSVEKERTCAAGLGRLGGESVRNGLGKTSLEIMDTFSFDVSPSKLREGGRKEVKTQRRKEELLVGERQEEGRRRVSQCTPSALEGDPTSALNQPDFEQERVYLPIKIEEGDLRDWASKDSLGRKAELVEANGEQLAVFKYGSSLLATSAQCPHAGGPLHLGDLEELPPGCLGLRCPWHGWTFEVGR